MSFIVDRRKGEMRMFAGHFGLAAAVKAKQPEIPLWALMLGTQLLDVIFVPLYVSGIETMESVGEGYGGMLIHAEYSHSLLSVLVLVFTAGAAMAVTLVLSLVSDLLGLG